MNLIIYAALILCAQLLVKSPFTRLNRTKNMRLQDIKTKSKIFIGFAFPIVLLLVLSVTVYWSLGRIVQTDKWVQHTHNVLSEASGIVASAVDMETGMRGYLLAGKEEFLDPYKGGESNTYGAIDSLQQTVNDNPAQVERLAQAKEILKEWQAEVTEPTIELRREIGDASTMNDVAKLVGEARGKTFFDAFREKIALFIEREEELLQKTPPGVCVCHGKGKRLQGAIGVRDGMGGTHQQGACRKREHSRKRRGHGNRHAWFPDRW